ncbi:hypothetical protein [Tepidimicrobium xylanilyticum]|uniref:Uncharacterized protein n=1 Tax=Tepidimicrobium xylanilyticum TaxID=1123352 RepID=A0A1H3EHW9_9FIRM|nr:hypothetical protein [Tepidimicrobium xylanilyticum]GMG96237.1 hypothetical protein EN5CB1_10630 [Tepidimicrobium xylanilyticum]SDX78185.1 hypothetical protein SAMN05660923_02918 [Tepidimicrobium xylanilyticum]
MNNQYSKTKKQNLRNEMIEYIEDTLDAAENMGSLDFFTIELKVHNGRLDTNCTLKNRKNVY